MFCLIQVVISLVLCLTCDFHCILAIFDVMLWDCILINLFDQTSPLYYSWTMCIFGFLWDLLRPSLQKWSTDSHCLIAYGWNGYKFSTLLKSANFFLVKVGYWLTPTHCLQVGIETYLTLGLHWHQGCRESWIPPSPFIQSHWWMGIKAKLFTRFHWK